MTVTAGEVLGEGREAVVYALDPQRVLKVFKPLADAEDRARREFTLGSLLFEHGVAVAQPLELTTRDGRPALIAKRIHGSTLNRLLSRKPWLVGKVAAQLASVQVGLHNVQPPAGLKDLHEIVATRVRSNPAVPASLVAAALRELESLPPGDRLCHGNVHLGNVIVSDGLPVLVDCGDTSVGDPQAEVAHTIVRYHCARLRADVPLVARFGTAIGRRLLGLFYVRAYQNLAAIDEAVVARWVGVRAVERLAEGHRHERRRLTRLANRNLSRRR